MVIEETKKSQTFVQPRQAVVSDVITHRFRHGILGNALAQVRESGFGGLHYPHDQVCEKDHSSAVTVVRKDED
jgi:hypothetical protein